MTCFFYTDPLAAAWMAKHHGVRFWNSQHEIHVLPLVDGEKEGHWLIHPESFQLLSPMTGDRDKHGLIYMNCRYHDKMSWVDVESDNYCKEESRTVWRNSRAFIWPESEDA